MGNCWSSRISSLDKIIDEPDEKKEYLLTYPIDEIIYEHQSDIDWNFINNYYNNNFYV